MTNLPDSGGRGTKRTKGSSVRRESGAAQSAGASAPRERPRSADPTPTINLANLARHFSDEGEAYKLMEQIRWDGKPVCPHCGVVDEATYLAPRGRERKTRTGKVTKRRLWKCNACRKQFSVLVGTIFERSKVSLDKWLLAVHLMCEAKNGVSAHEIHRAIGVSYQTAWFMAHRIRFAMERPPLVDKLSGIVEVDETYVGGKAKYQHKGKRAFARKTAVVTLVERESGEARSQVVANVTGQNINKVLRENMTGTAVLMTDESSVYTAVGRQFPSHHTVNHSADEYVRGHAHVNTAEGYFSQLKRSLDGTYHRVSEDHLHRYLAEFDYRYNTRKMPDGERTMRTIRQAAGRRLTYREPRGA